MEINGVPLHPLVVHAAVVLTPLACLAALAYCVPAWRDWVRWPLVVLAAVAAVSVWVAFLSGDDFRDDPRFDFAAGTPLEDKLENHEEWAERLRIGASVFAVLAFVAAWFHTRTGPVRTALTVLSAVAALATLVLVVLTGDAGAQATWKIDS